MLPNSIDYLVLGHCISQPEVTTFTALLTTTYQVLGGESAPEGLAVKLFIFGVYFENGALDPKTPLLVLESLTVYASY